MKCNICGKSYAEYYFKDEYSDEIMCEDCLLEIDGMTSTTITSYFLDGEYMGNSDEYYDLYDNICENTSYRKIEE